MSRNKSIRRAVGHALLTSAAAAATTVLPAHAADEGAESIQEIIVTGSRIAREDVGALPVTIVTSEEIKATGEQSISDVLRRSTFNNFGSLDPESGTGSGQGSSAIDLRGLGAQRTLVLIDGRRAVASPALNGAYVNVNSLPFAAVDRIDILRDGASAVYGSDAIGGVINIITKKDFEGVQLSGQLGFPDEEGGDETAANMVWGATTDRSSVLVAFDYSEKEIIYSRDRDYTFESRALSPTGGPGSFRRRNADGSGIEGPLGLWEPDPRCPAAVDTDAIYPNSARIDVGTGIQCGFRYAAVAAESAAIERNSALLSGTYDVSDDVELFGRINFSRVESFGRYAPAPYPGGFVMSATNPNNPTLGEVAPGVGYRLQIAYRATDLGPRDNFVTETLLQGTGGVRGEMDVLGGLNWEFAAYHGTYDIDEVGTGYGLISNAEQAIENGTFNPFLPPGPGNSAAAAFGHTINSDNRVKSEGMDFGVSFAPFSLPAGEVGFAVGAEYREDSYNETQDAQTQAGNVFGTAGGSAAGDRDYWAVYAEASIPITQSLEGSLALRHDDYSDFGSSVSPKLSLKWQPFEQLGFRASFGEGFAAPDLNSLYKGPTQAFDFAVDTSRCATLGDAFSCGPQFQKEARRVNNPELDAEESEQYSFGTIVSLLDNQLRISLDYYNIEITNSVYQLSSQEVFDFEFACRTTGANCGDVNSFGQVIRDPGTGEHILTITPVANFGVEESNGLDFAANLSIDSDIGKWGFGVEASHVLSYETATTFDPRRRETIGYITDDFESGRPENRANLSVDWSNGTLAAGVFINWIDSFQACTAPQAGQTEAQAGCDGTEIDSLTTVDVQGTWFTPWEGQLTLGVRNAFNEEPPIDCNSFSDCYSQELHAQGFFGRIPYLRYTQSF